MPRPITTLPPEVSGYRREIQVVSRERDFYGFVMADGEARVEDGRLLVTERSNNPMTGEQGSFHTRALTILEHFPQHGYLKVAEREHVPEVFDMSSGRTREGHESLRLTRDGFDPEAQAHVERGVAMLAAHGELLFGLPASAVPALERLVGALGDGEVVTFEGLHLHRRRNVYDLDRDGSFFVMRAALLAAGWSYRYVEISYSFAWLSKQVRARFEGDGWWVR